MTKTILPHDAVVSSHLLQGFSFGQYTQLAVALDALSNMLRQSMANSQLYVVPLDAFPAQAEGVTLTQLAQGISPYNIAAAILRVCDAGPSMGGEALVVPADLHVYVDAWVPLSMCTYAEEVVRDPAPLVEPVVEATPEPAAEPADTPTATPTPVATRVGLPTTDVLSMPDGRLGRPLKSPFAVSLAPRAKFGTAPFWWAEMAPRWSRVLTEAPGACVGKESSGSAPVISYAVMVHCLQLSLANVPAHLTVGDLQKYLSDVRESTARSPAGPVAFTLLDHLFTT